MRKPKREDEEEPAHFFGEDFESDDFADGDDDNNGKGDSRRKRPARERVELRNEQQMLRRQLSDWDDYDQDDFDTKLD
jgi:hypothetical protein